MRVFVYEFVTGGGWYSYRDTPPTDSLHREGRAMVEALAADFSAIARVEVCLLHDTRLPELRCAAATQLLAVSSRLDELAAFRQFAQTADWTVLIVPESAGFLAQRAAIIEKLGGRLLGPPLDAIRLTGDKHLTAEHLSARGLPTPRGLSLEAKERPPETFSYPAVLKPRDGAGSQGIQLLATADEAHDLTEPSRLELFWPGQPASVAFLCGPSGNVALEPCLQQLSRDRRLAYEGGSLPLAPDLSRRAVALGSRALETLGPLCGYLGVDLVIGENEKDDVLIEINPRLTTSYVGLRAATGANLAQAMLQVAEGSFPHIAFGRGKIQFAADGRLV